MAALSISEFISSITGRGLEIAGLLPSAEIENPVTAIVELCHILLTSRGEASGIALSQEILSRYRTLNNSQKKTFFDALYDEFSAKHQIVERAARDYLHNPTPLTLANLSSAAMSSRQKLFARLNQAPDATRLLVDMRRDILEHLPINTEFKTIDTEFVQLFTSWFNRGFLELREMDWQTSAVILEKIIEYEAVHGISGWDALRKRLEPRDRRIYGFFHPRLVNEPLIFVEVALMDDMPSSIGQILADERPETDPDTAKTAVFYSISNCQEGLRGIPLGNFLIKQVVKELQSGLPNLREFVTLSPVPDLGSWLGTIEDQKELSFFKQTGQIKNFISSGDWVDDKRASALLEEELTAAAAWYLREVKNTVQRPLDPVARFHLGNGARLERINWAADTSRAGLQSSLGIMVNYRYHIDDIERNHEQYEHSGLVISSPDVTRSAKRFGKLLQTGLHNEPDKTAIDCKNTAIISRDKR